MRLQFRRLMASKMVIKLVVAAALGMIVACDTVNPPAGSTDTSAARQNVAAMSREHADDNGQPSPAAEIPPERSIVAERLPYAEVDEELVY